MKVQKTTRSRVAFMTLIAILSILASTSLFNSPVAAKSASSAPAPLACVPPPPGMVAWYPFDESSGPTAAEIINSNDGTHVNGPTPFTGMKVANSLRFDGHNDYVEAPTAPELNFGAHQNFSIDFWINTTQVQRGAQVILDKRTWSPLRGYSVYLHRGRVGLQLADNSGYSNYTGNSAAFVADGKWHMVAITVNREKPFGQIYVDGNPVYSFTPNRNGSLANSSSLYFGDSPFTSGNRALRGVLDEVEIFDRLLTHAEIDAIYNADSAGKCKKGFRFGETEDYYLK